MIGDLWFKEMFESVCVLAIWEKFRVKQQLAPAWRLVQYTHTRIHIHRGLLSAAGNTVTIVWSQVFSQAWVPEQIFSASLSWCPFIHNCNATNATSTMWSGVHNAGWGETGSSGLHFLSTNNHFIYSTLKQRPPAAWHVTCFIDGQIALLWLDYLV